ncbi:MAG: hypothetical protein IIZ43_01020 [Eubacterium sp.]|jgi:two-component system response regulator (stage 0 sporulation protein A)|nr:hypothetical protein [Eubacterium sp.]
MNQEKKLFGQIGRYVKALGVPIHIAGYMYLCDAVQVVLEDFSSVYSVTKRVYPVVAKQHGVSSYNVQKCIGKAIRDAVSAQTELMQEMFGDYFSGRPAKPVSPVIFIARVSWRIRVENDQ